MVLGWAVNNDLISKNPALRIKLPKVTNTKRCVKRHVLTPEQITALVGILPEPYATLVLFISQTGLRIGEAIALKESDFKGNVIHVARRIYRREAGPLKTKKSYRPLPVSEDLKQRLLGISGGEWIFCSRTGNVVDGLTALVYYLRPACEKLGIELGGWHDFRHTLTTKLRKDGTHPRVIADILGHSKVNLAMDVYDRSDADDLTRALVTSGHNPKLENAQNQPNMAVFQ